MEALNSASLGAMGSLLGKLEELLKAEDDEARSIRQLKDDVASISTKLVKLSEVFDSPITVKYWMKDARELSYDMEDCVEQFFHADGADGKLNWMKKISGFKARVDEVTERYDRYELESVLSSSTITNTLVSHPLGTAYGEHEPIVPVGMDGPTSELFGWLKPNGDDGEEQLKVISILGVDGIGKSTLAQQLWRDLGGEFGCHAFVQMAKKPDMRMILRNILSQVRPHQPPQHCQQVQDLIYDLRKHLHDKRYFIIIDDLWAVSVWDVISRSFPEGNSCSRILTTTAIEDVALACCSYDPQHIFKMEPLSANHSKQLFVSRVFGSGKECSQELFDFSDQITRKCGGLPLIIICIATVVSRQPGTVHQLEFVQNFLRHGLKTSPSFAHILTQGLKLCYSSLPHCLKTCLLYLSVYPENYIILKEDLVNQWGAEGFICPMGGKDTVEVARSYFDQLVSLGLIQQMNINCNKVLSYAVHPMVFDYITGKSIEDNFITVIDYSESTVVLSDKIRRLSLHFGSATYATIPAGIGLEHVRSLTFVGLLNNMPSLVEFKLLRVVTLHLWCDNGDTSLLLTGICSLFLLRYLQIRCNVTVELPGQMLGLKHLETLEINARVSTVPSDIVHLPSLLRVLLGGRRNHKHLTTAPVASGKAVSMASSSASSLPVLLQRLELLPPICIFPRLPMWIRRLRELYILEVVVRELQGDDIYVLSELPALTALTLHVRTPTAERIAFGRGAFPALEYFKFLCGVLFLDFQEEAMPKLRKLKIGFNAHRGETYDHMLAGIPHLLNLQEISARVGATTGAEESDRSIAESALKEAIRTYGCHQSLKVKRVDRIDQEYDISEKHKWSPQEDYSNALKKGLQTRKEDSSSEQPAGRLGTFLAKYTKKLANVGISQLSHRRREIYIDVSGQNDHRLDFGQIKRFSWRELQIATNNFSEQNVLGKGGFGKVYKGVLPGPDNAKVAVKRLMKVESSEGEMAFLREVELISIAVHKNILRLIGFCTTPTERLLVYPFMENLSVASRLRDIKLNEPALDWPTRMRIALGAARGLEYLHEHCNPKIIHRDVKAANVLLDGNFEAVVGDFGLAKMVDIGRNTVTTGLRGTMGHIAPEYIKTGRPSVKTDIFGYGVMLLEIVTGERATSFIPNRIEEAGEIMLNDQVKLCMGEGRLQDIVDRNLDGVYNLNELEKITQIALLCTHNEPDQRPAMSEVVQMLEGDFVLAERWEQFQLARRQQHEMGQQRKLFDFSEESLNIQEAIDLSAGR